VSGQVVERASGLGLEGAIVTLGPSGRGTQRREVTDGSGKFLFAAVPPGQYRLAVEKEGFIAGAFGKTGPESLEQLLTVPAAGVSGVRVNIWRYAAIGGTVRNSGSVPLGGIEVIAVRRSVLSG